MKDRALNLSLLLVSLFGYLEWGKDNSSFLFEAEYEVVRLLLTDPAEAAHPFSLLPLFGQILLLITLFQKKPGRGLTLVGIACIGLLLLFMFFIGIVGPNFRILASTLPFLFLSGIAIARHARRARR